MRPDTDLPRLVPQKAQQTAKLVEQLAGVALSQWPTVVGPMALYELKRSDVLN
jgi:hypothetical protein